MLCDSTHWCPVCKTSTIALSSRKSMMATNGTGIARPAPPKKFQWASLVQRTWRQAASGPGRVQRSSTIVALARHEKHFLSVLFHCGNLLLYESKLPELGRALAPANVYLHTRADFSCVFPCNCAMRLHAKMLKTGLRVPAVISDSRKTANTNGF